MPIYRDNPRIKKKSIFYGWLFIYIKGKNSSQVVKIN